MPPDSPLAPEIFRLAVEASPSGMVLVDGGGAIVMVNGEIERLFGYGRDELAASQSRSCCPISCAAGTCASARDL